MKTQSNDQPQVYEVSGQELRVHFNVEQITREGIDGPETFWQADEALCHVADSRSALIEKIIATKYSVAAEIATINNQATDPVEYSDYQAFRVEAKNLSDGWLAIKEAP